MQYDKNCSRHLNTIFLETHFEESKRPMLPSIEQ